MTCMECRYYDINGECRRRAPQGFESFFGENADEEPLVVGKWPIVALDASACGEFDGDDKKTCDATVTQEVDLEVWRKIGEALIFARANAQELLVKHLKTHLSSIDGNIDRNTYVAKRYENDINDLSRLIEYCTENNED